MSTPASQFGQLLGLVDVNQTMTSFNKDDRLNIAEVCCDMVCGGRAHGVKEKVPLGTLGRVDKAIWDAEVSVVNGTIQVFHNQVRVTSHKVTGVSVFTAIPGTNGKLVYIGKCQEHKKRMAVVLQLSSDREAQILKSRHQELQVDGPESRHMSNLYQVSADPSIPPPDYEDLTPPPLLPPWQNLPPPTSPKQNILSTWQHVLPPHPQQRLPASLPLPSGDLPPPPLPSPRQRVLPPPPPSPESLVFEQALPPIPAAREHIYDQVNLSIPQEPIYATIDPSLPTPPHQQQPGDDNYYSQPVHDINQYENPQGGSSTGLPPPLPLRQGSSGSDQDSNCDVYDWPSDDGREESPQENYYTALGIDIREAEQIYMTTSMNEEQQERGMQEKGDHKRQKRQKQRKKEEDKYNEEKEDTEEEDDDEEEEEEDQEEFETTLEEDISAFLKDEYKFKTTIWRIREATHSLTRELQHLLRGTETLADIQNDMYVELYEGYKSPSKIAQVFISRKDQLERYKYYLMKSPQINKLTEAQPEEVKKMFPKLKENIRSSWKRLYFYCKSLEKMLATAPPDDVQVVQEAVDMLRELTRQGDSGIMMEAVKGTPFNLHDYAPLLLHSSFDIRSSSIRQRKGDYRVLLFAMMLVVTVPREDKFEYQEFIPTENLRVVSSKRDTRRTFVLEAKLGQGGKRMYGFRAPSDEAKDVWVMMINRAIKGTINKMKI
ncbi:uncharacterized protein LOC121870028 isoform X2 [Homarus americanus]|uniref:uncharacterized protein LOC121870028 isoform X2 n=1 Tax=Homarus americanus TaxID=6706 RepID=UPI001C43ACBC|nr:uncharacterized protein LOC121870028 isoform X2 [Homarus americanus]